jgi:MFS family permease
MPAGLPASANKRALGAEGPRGLWAPQTRLLTIGLILTITFVASESLAVVTVMPVVARRLGGLPDDRRWPAAPFVTGLTLFSSGLAVAGLATSMRMLAAGRALQGLGAAS